MPWSISGNALCERQRWFYLLLFKKERVGARIVKEFSRKRWKKWTTNRLISKMRSTAFFKRKRGSSRSKPTQADNLQLWDQPVAYNDDNHFSWKFFHNSCSHSHFQKAGDNNTSVFHRVPLPQIDQGELMQN